MRASAPIIPGGGAGLHAGVARRVAVFVAAAASVHEGLAQARLRVVPKRWKETFARTGILRRGAGRTGRSSRGSTGAATRASAVARAGAIAGTCAAIHASMTAGIVDRRVAAAGDEPAERRQATEWASATSSPDGSLNPKHVHCVAPPRATGAV